MRENKIWQIEKPDLKLAADLSRELGISPTLAKILSQRGFASPQEAKTFLYCTRENLSSPLDIPGMKEGVARIYQAIEKGESIVIYGDYDVDGITATALLYLLLRRLGGRVCYYIPDRLEEGYGFNKSALLQAGRQGVSVVLSVDCGISSVEETAYATSLGLSVIITDHHQPPAVLPQATAIINPKLAVEKLPSRELAGVGVAYMFAQALAEKFGRSEWCSEYLDLVALGTIADIVPLTKDNRILVKEGLALIRKINRPGLIALLEICGLKEAELSAEHIGYWVAPRLNACGRLGNASLGVELLISDDWECAYKTAYILDQENRTRQNLENAILEQAMAMAEAQRDVWGGKVIVLAAHDWHPGVIGIVASRLAGKYYRPVIMISLENGVGKGSGRSIPGFNLYEALEHVKDCLLNFGGHEMAAGLSIKEEKIPCFEKAINDYADHRLQEKDLIPVLHADCEVLWQDLNVDLVKEIAMLAPFGYHNPCPLLVLRSIQLDDLKEVGAKGNHLKLRVRGENSWLDAIAFQKGCYREEAAGTERFDLAVVPEINTYNGHSRLQLVIKDFKPATEQDDPFRPVSFLDQLFQEGELWLEDNYYRDIINRVEFFTKLAGVSFAGRQDIIRKIDDGDSVLLVREPDNEYDAYAIAVFWQDQKIGYLNAGLARNLAPVIDRGIQYEAYITRVTGRDKENLGVNICVRKKEQEIQKNEALAARRQQLKKLPARVIKEIIRQAVLGDSRYHEKQEEALNSLEEGHNSLVIFATGRGKSAIFQSAAAYLALTRDLTTIIVYPLRSLVNDQLQHLRSKLGGLGLSVELANGSLNQNEKKEFFVRLLQGNIDIILTTPEFLQYHLEKFQNISGRLGLFVVDEAHHLAKGKRRGYRTLAASWNKLGNPLALAVTATADDEAAQRIVDLLLCSRVIIEDYTRANLRLVDQRRARDKMAYLLQLIAGGDRIVIYVNSRKQAYQLACDIRLYYPPVKEEIAFYHGGLHSEQRTVLEEMFRRGELRVIVTTSAFGEGINIPDIKHVVLYHLSFSRTEFNQLAGRAGRNGQEAYIHLLFGEKDKALNELILDGVIPTRDVLGRVYLFLRELHKTTNPIQITNTEISEAMQKAGLKNFNEQTASACLSILEELGLVLREIEGNQRFIHFVPPPPGKLDLSDSVRYLEGLDEREEFQEFASLVLQKNEQEILREINKPIFPQKPLKLLRR